MRKKSGNRPQFSRAALHQHHEATRRLGMTNVDLCHRIPYRLIREKFSSYLKKELSKRNFLEFVDLLFDANSTACPKKNKVLTLLESTDLETNRKKCRQILSLLNSASANLRPGNSSFNRSIGAKIDVSVSEYRFTPQSKRVMSALKEKELLPLSGEARIRTSFFSENQGTPVGKEITPKRLTPDSFRLFSRALTGQSPQSSNPLAEQDDSFSPKVVARRLFSDM